MSRLRISPQNKQLLVDLYQRTLFTTAGTGIHDREEADAGVWDERRKRQWMRWLPAYPRARCWGRSHPQDQVQVAVAVICVRGAFPPEYGRPLTAVVANPPFTA